MATQDKDNVVLYEFQGNTLPLEKAFAQVGKLFRRYIREAKAAAIKADPLGNPKGKLDDDTAAAAKELKNLYKRLKVYSDKAKSGVALTKKEEADAKKIFKTLSVRTKQFLDFRNKLIRESNKQIKKETEAKQERKDWTAASSQFKAGVQAEQLDLLVKSLPNLPPHVISDINSYIQAWKDAKDAFDGSEDSVKRLASATKNLDQKAREYSATLKTMTQNQKMASNLAEKLLMPIIRMVSSFYFWFRVIKEGTIALGDYIESLNFLDVAINNINWSGFTKEAKDASKAVDNLTESLENARWTLGLNATASNTAAATYVSFANAMKLTGESAVKFSQNMTQISIDMASLYNKDALEMMTALRSALAGNTRAMMNYGISVHDATLNEWLYSKGIKKTMTSISETSQMMVRYMYIMERTTQAQGDLSRTLTSPANQLRVLGNQVSLLRQNLGALFQLVIYPAIRMLNEILVPLNAFLSALTSIASKNYSQAIGNTTDSFEDLADSINDTSDAARGLSSLDEINQMTVSQSNVKIGIDADVQALFDQIQVYGKFNTRVNKLAEAFKAVGEILAPIWAMLTDTTVLDGISIALNGIGYALSPIKMLLDWFRQWFNTWPDWLKNIVSGITKTISIVFGLAAAITAAVLAFKLLSKAMGSVIFKTFILVLKQMISALAATIVKVLAAAAAHWQLAIAIIAAAGVGALAVAAIVVSAVNIAKSQQNTGMPEFKGMPGMAKGGVVTGPTLALVGEGQYNEAVVPLGNSPQFESMKESIAERVIERSGGRGPVQDLPARPIVLSIDGRTLGRAQINDISQVRRQVGVGVK